MRRLPANPALWWSRKAASATPRSRRAAADTASIASTDTRAPPTDASSALLSSSETGREGQRASQPYRAGSRAPLSGGALVLVDKAAEHIDTLDRACRSREL